MSKGTIICFGDSNTYGYDPATGGRIPKEFRWPEIIAAETEWNTINLGFNGKQIPHTEEEVNEVWAILQEAMNLEGPVKMWILLGTNDIQMNFGWNAERVGERMHELIRLMKVHRAVKDGKVELTILAPAKVEEGPWSDEAIVAEMKKLSDEYYAICFEEDVEFFDLSAIDIALAGDGDHFSREGHRTVADTLKKELLHISTN